MVDKQSNHYMWGYNRGLKMAEGIFTFTDIDGTVEFTLASGKSTTDFDEALQELFYSEENDRQFSPFEFTAHELNSLDDPDTAWDNFETGLSDGMYDALKNALHEAKKEVNYGSSEV